MRLSSPLLVVFKTTGGKRWHGRDGLQPLSGPQRRNRRKNVEQVLKNQSVLKMAAASEPDVPTRLYKPLNLWRLQWMKGKLDMAKSVLKWDTHAAAKLQPANHPGNAVVASAQAQRLAALLRATSTGVAPGGVSVSYEARVLALSQKLRALHGQQPQLSADAAQLTQRQESSAQQLPSTSGHGAPGAG